MYIPTYYKITDINEVIGFMKQYSFAVIVVSENNVPVATHLPFVVEERAGKIILISHFAKANKQWENIERKEVLVIFSEPHAYISPKHYEKELNVPTWNYVSVHAYGQVNLVHEEDKAIESLEKMIMSFDAAYKNQWNHLPKDYVLGMVKGIVPFEMEVKDIQGKKKLSQNKTEKEKQNIVEALKNSSDTNEQTIAKMMDSGKLF